MPASQSNGPVEWGDLTSWHPDPGWLMVIAALAAGYVGAEVVLRRRGVAWPVGRTVAWLLGLVTLRVVTCTGVAVCGC